MSKSTTHFPSFLPKKIGLEFQRYTYEIRLILVDGVEMFSDGVCTLGDGETRGKSLGTQIRFLPNPTTSVRLHVFWGTRGPEAVLEK